MEGAIGTYASGSILGRTQNQKFVFYVKNTTVNNVYTLFANTSTSAILIAAIVENNT